MDLPSISRAKDLLGSFVSRIFLGFLAMATIVANLPLLENLRFDPEKAIVVSVAIAAWLASEWASWQSSAHPHDVKLRNQLFIRISPGLEFLREHDFGVSFNIDELSGIRHVADGWDGVQFKFRDNKIEAKWSKLLRETKHFSHFVAMNSHMLSGSAKLASFKTDQDRHQGMNSHSTDANIAQANKLATSLWEGFEELEDLCLTRIGAFDELG